MRGLKVYSGQSLRKTCVPEPHKFKTRQEKEVKTRKKQSYSLQVIAQDGQAYHKTNNTVFSDNKTRFAQESGAEEVGIRPPQASTSCA